MPFRQRLKEARNKVRNALSGQDITRPSTPTGPPSHSSPATANDQYLNPSFGPPVPLSSSPSQVSASPALLPGSGLNTPSRAQQTPQSPSTAGEELPNVKESHAAPPGTGSQAIPMRSADSASENAPESQGSGNLCSLLDSEESGRNEAQPVEGRSPVEYQEVPDKTLMRWKNLKEFVRVLAPVTSVFGPVKEMVEMAGKAQIGYEALRVRLEGLFDDLQQHFGEGRPPTMTPSIESICGSIQAELSYIKQRQERNTGERILEASDEQDAILACYRRIEGHLQRLSLNSNLSMWRIIQDQATESRSKRMSSRIERLPCSLPAWYDSAEGAELRRRQCTPGTRVDVLANMLSWARDGGGGGVYWLNGMAGTGKTTIAYSVCADLDSSCQLGASFFCSRLREECRNVDLIIPSIAYQLARFSRPFQSALSTVLEKDPDVHGRLPQMQFDKLITTPLLEVQHTLPESLIIVIDALDECEQKESTGRILDILLSKSTGLPIRFIVSSRPESHIRDRMADERAERRLVLHELEKGEVQADVEKYLRESLAPMGPSEVQIAALVAKAGILFIYAATAVRYIGYDNFQSDPGDRLHTILNGSPSQEDGENEEIDQLYTTVLEAALGSRGLRKIERDNMRQVLHTVICALEPLTVAGISQLLRINNLDRVRTALRPLWSVLHVVGASEVVTTLHASFPDFMFDPIRSKKYCCNSNAHHCLLAERCLESIAQTQTQTQLNICGLESSYLPDKQVPNIEDRVAEAIPMELVYACRYWADHVKAGDCSSSVVEQLRDFLSKRLLLWMEVLNLTGHMRAGAECMQRMAEWCKAFAADLDLVDLALDAQRFAEVFTSNPVLQSTPHIYVSMLAFWPKQSPIAKHYERYTRGPLIPEGTALDQRQPALLAKWTFESFAHGIAFSPNGLYIALVIDGDVFLVDAYSGRAVLGPLGRPSGTNKELRVTRVAFSPNGDRVLAAFPPSYHSPYNDFTVLGWDAYTGHLVLGPLSLKGHNAEILSYSFSPDCTRMITSSRDQTIRMWDLQTGDALLSLSTEQEAYAITYSVDGTQIVAGGWAVQVWDTQTGNTIFGPCAMSDPIGLIAISPDTYQIICARIYDTTIHIGDVENGNLTFRPTNEHSRGFASLGYSPTGRYFVSDDSFDNAVWVWDAQDGKPILGPLYGHTDAMISVAFSPNGTRIISSSFDGLICIWDAQQNNLTGDVSNAPVDPVCSVKFSSDGTRFVTGTITGTIGIWDTGTGEMKPGPIKAHASGISAIDFFDDRVVSGSYDGKICIYDAQGGDILLGPLDSGSSSVTAVAFSPNGQRIAIGLSNNSDDNDLDHTMHIWESQTGEEVLGPLTLLDQRVASVQFSRDGTRIIGSTHDYSGKIAIWDASNGNKLFEVLKEHSDSIRSVSLSPDGTLIAAGSDDCTILLWDAQTGKRSLGPFTGNSGFVASVDFSPDTTRLVSSSYDRTIRIWDVQSREMIFELPHGHEYGIKSAAYSPDGAYILSLSGDGIVRVHDARTPKERAQSAFIADFGDWMMNKDGWIVDDQSRLLAWVPGDLRRSLLWPRTITIIPHGNLRLKFDKSRMGEAWARSFATQT